MGCAFKRGAKRSRRESGDGAWIEALYCMYCTSSDIRHITQGTVKLTGEGLAVHCREREWSNDASSSRKLYTFASRLRITLCIPSTLTCTYNLGTGQSFNPLVYNLFPRLLNEAAVALRTDRLSLSACACACIIFPAVPRNQGGKENLHHRKKNAKLAMLNT